jgi:hypothetical protein
MNSCEENIKEHIMGVECDFVDWINLAQNGGPIIGFPLGVSTTLFLSVFNIYVRSLI